jgi:hypothetical protein
MSATLKKRNGAGVELGGGAVVGVELGVVGTMPAMTPSAQLKPPVATVRSTLHGELGLKSSDESPPPPPQPANETRSDVSAKTLKRDAELKSVFEDRVRVAMVMLRLVCTSSDCQRVSFRNTFFSLVVYGEPISIIF